jgi:hypothetical protein
MLPPPASPDTCFGRRALSALLFGLAAAGGVFTSPAAQACGYHSADDIAVGLLNWAFPKALYVRTAVWTAENIGLLPPRELQRPKDMFAFQKAAADLRAFASRLAAGGKGEGETVSLAVVLIDSVLWTRFEATPDGYTADVHANGPKSDDVVVVTDGKVLRALIEGSLDAAKAEAHGLFRLYRRPELHDTVRSILMMVTQERAYMSPIWYTP